MHGFGHLTLTDDYSYKGEIFENDPHGYGILKRPDGKEYHGHFFKNKMHGLVMLKEQDQTESFWLMEDGKYLKHFPSDQINSDE